MVVRDSVTQVGLLSDQAFAEAQEHRASDPHSPVP